MQLIYVTFNHENFRTYELVLGKSLSRLDVAFKRRIG